MSKAILPSVADGIEPSPLNPTGSGGRQEILSKKAQARVNMVEAREWLTRLTKNPDFRRYQLFILKGVKRMKEKAGEIDTLPPEKRDAYTQRFLGIEALYEWPEEQLAAVTEAEQRIENELRAILGDEPPPRVQP